MNFLFAPDSFKGSLTALEITRILERVTLRHFPDAHTRGVPVADGGEGTVEALVTATRGQYRQCQVTGPLGDTVTATWGLLGGAKTAVLEMAQASGLPLTPPDRRDPRRTTTLGTGEMMRLAAQDGAEAMLLGIGGSATNDGGMGMLTALGARFEDAQGHALPPVGGNLGRVERVILDGLDERVRGMDITVICDVTNPLLGPEGATYVYGPQKGATPEICRELEDGMRRYAEALSRAAGRDVARFAGAGAAGGLGAALGGVLGAKMRPGIDAVLDAVGFDELLETADLVITGEGRMDGQSVRFGKVPVGVARRCQARGVAVLAVVGGLGEGAEGFYDTCLSALQVTPDGPMSLEYAMQNAARLYETAADRALRAVKIGMRLSEKQQKNRACP